MNGWEQNDHAAAIAQSWVNGGAKQERERIIALLQREASEWISHYGKCDCRIRGEEDLRLIELIKGENE